MEQPGPHQGISSAWLGTPDARQDLLVWVFFPLLKTRPVMASLWVKGLQRINRCPYAADTVFASVHYHQKQSAVRWVQL